MDYSEILGKLSVLRDEDPGSECSISRVLSLPLEFLVSLVRNQREAQLLLQVSSCASSLDQLAENYEMIAVRSQGLQGAWDELWLSKDPFVAPAIPLIGSEMSGINKGRCILLEKMDIEIKRLQDLEKQLCHHIDVNYSLVEELQMEGINKLATKKLLLVEVEKELARRITCICNNESVRGFSTMRQFLHDLGRNPAPIYMTSGGGDMNKEPFDSLPNESCSTEKITPDKFSQPTSHADGVSPGSQSYASKCIALTAHGENVVVSVKERSGDVSASQKTSELQESPLGLSLSSSKETLSRDGKPDARNQSSSASEERLPVQILNDSSPIISRTLLMDVCELNRNPNTEIRNASPPALNVKVSNGGPQLQTDGIQAINSENPPNTMIEQKSSELVLHEPIEKQILSQLFQSVKFNLSKKRPFEPTGPDGGRVMESIEVLGRDPKRLLLQTGPEGGKAICSVEMPFFGAQETSDRNHIQNCEAHSGTPRNQAAGLERLASKSEESPTSCSCDPENTFRTQGRCTDCGCVQPELFKQHDISWTPSCNPEDDYLADASLGIQGQESPMLATQ